VALQEATTNNRVVNHCYPLLCHYMIINVLAVNASTRAGVEVARSVYPAASSTGSMRFHQGRRASLRSRCPRGCLDTRSEERPARSEGGTTALTGVLLLYLFHIIKLVIQTIQHKRYNKRGFWHERTCLHSQHYQEEETDVFTIKKWSCIQRGQDDTACSSNIITRFTTTWRDTETDCIRHQKDDTITAC